jgi:hypothetical protein
MLQEEIERNPLIEFMVKNSLLSYAQVDTLLIDRRKKGSLKEKAIVRNGGPVKKGAFVRTLKQAERKVIKACYTIMLLSTLNVLDMDTISGLVKIGEMIKELPEKLGLEQVQDLKIILEEVMDRVIKMTKEDVA